MACLLLPVFLIGSLANADDVSIGDLVISNAHTLATPPGARTAAGFMVIRNNGTTADRLIGGQATFAEITEVHQVSSSGGVSKMQRVRGGLEIPAGGEVKLKSGGYHMMFMQIAQQLEPGAEVTMTLNFEKAGKVVVVLPVMALGSHNHSATN